MDGAPLAKLPQPSPRAIALRVTAAAERALRGGHPWLFADAITRQSHQGQPGDLAVVFDRKGRFLAAGLLDPTSPIRVRVLQTGEPAAIDQAWLEAKLAAAAAIRASLPSAGTDGYRLVHGENDGLPGLVVDRYAGSLVLKLYAAAWISRLPAVLPALQAVQPAQRVILRLSRAVDAAHPLLGLADGDLLAGPPLDGPLLFQENGLHFEADPIHGHKTGFYLDQRENRMRVATLAAGRRVLNLFAYTGAFSVYAAWGGAASVTSVDVSRPALEAAERNVALNAGVPAVAAARHEIAVGDAFEALERLARARRRFDLVILDPPSFARSQAQVPHALAAYRRLTTLALKVLVSDGLLVQSSCTGRVHREEFFGAVNQAARQAGRPLAEIERSGQPLDHPAGFPEGAYLKCLFASVP